MYNDKTKRKWFYCLKPRIYDDTNKKFKRKKVVPLFEYYNDYTNNMIVQFDACPDWYDKYKSKAGFNYNTKDTKRLFGLFSNFLDFAAYVNEYIPRNGRCFYETILGDQVQKPHFDIDIKRKDLVGKKYDEIDIVGALVDSLINIFLEMNLPLNLSKNILLFSSHGKEKLSFHLIIDGYCHSNNLEAKAFYEKVIEDIPKDMRQWIDHAVYSSLQQFRILGNQKVHSNRFKIFMSKWSYYDNVIFYEYPEKLRLHKDEINNNNCMSATTIEKIKKRNLHDLSISLVTNIGSCLFLPSFINERSNTKNNKYQIVEDLDKSVVNNVLNMLGAKANMNITDRRFPYRFKSVSGGLIMLDRIRPSNCQMCKRIHHNENPYLIVTGKNRSIYFNCRRYKNLNDGSGNNDSFFIGSLGPDPDFIDEDTLDDDLDAELDDFNPNIPRSNPSDSNPSVFNSVVSNSVVSNSTINTINQWSRNKIKELAKQTVLPKVSDPRQKELEKYQNKEKKREEIGNSLKIAFERMKNQRINSRPSINPSGIDILEPLDILDQSEKIKDLEIL